ncbi:unnamed protein product [Alopecurus aequalis]
MATMKQAVVALMLALVVPAPGGARAACDASQLAVCLPAITTGRKPAPACCTNLKAQQGCLCQYAKDPNYGRYITSPNTRKTLASCGLAVPQC